MQTTVTPGYIQFDTFTTEFLPDSYALGAFIPNGVLDVSHLEIAAPDNWINVLAAGVTGVAFNNDTQVLNFPIGADLGITPEMIPAIRFRRVTPKELWRDPLATGARVSEYSLDANANQGLFVAVEAAGAAGVDPYAELSPTRANTLPLAQHSMNLFGADADLTQTVWPFRFSGGYLDRAHVRAQVYWEDEWHLLNLTTEDAGTANPYRFISDFTLYLDLSAFPGCEALLIFRRTPRDIRVAVPEESVAITAEGLRPGASYAYYAAVELGEGVAVVAAPPSFIRNGRNGGGNVGGGGGSSAPLDPEKDMPNSFTVSLAVVGGIEYNSTPEEEIDLEDDTAGGGAINSSTLEVSMTVAGGIQYA